MPKYYERDLWLEARQKNAKRFKGLRNFIDEALFTIKTISYPGKVRKVLSLTAIAQRPDVVLMPDFNKYRIRNLKPYVDAGFKAFLFRIGGPSQWVQGDWKYQLDPTYRGYIEQADKLGVLDQSIGYIVHNGFEDRVENSTTHKSIHTQLIDEWTGGGYMPRAFMYDHEVGYCFNGAGQKITITGYNLVQSLGYNTDNTWKSFKRTVSTYSADWFMRQWWSEHDTYYHNINKPTYEGGPGVQRPLVEAWYPGTLAKTYGSAAPILDDLLTPTPEQVGKYLYCGYQANAWQFTSALKLAGSMPDGSDDSVGVDCSISLDPSKTFYYNFDLIEPGATPPPPPPDPGGDVAQRLADLELGQGQLAQRIGAVESWGKTFPGK